MSIYFTSDTHFGHERILTYDRGKDFANVHHMDSVLIRKWNHLVKPQDTIYHLGDFAMGQKTGWPKIRQQLQGKIILVRGNHDMLPSTEDKFINDCSFDEVHDELYLEYGGYVIWMAHFPTNGDDYTRNRGYIRTQPKQHFDLALCGHVHTAWQAAPDGCINVGTDMHDYAPVHINTIFDIWSDQGMKTPKAINTQSMKG